MLANVHTATHTILYTKARDDDYYYYYHRTTCPLNTNTQRAIFSIYTRATPKPPLLFFFYIHCATALNGRGRRARRQRKSIFSLTCRFLTHLVAFVGSLNTGGGEKGNRHTQPSVILPALFSLRLFSIRDKWEEYI